MCVRIGTYMKLTTLHLKYFPHGDAMLTYFSFIVFVNFKSVYAHCHPLGACFFV